MNCVHSVRELYETLAPGRPQFLELWAETENGQAMCALVNGGDGWLMYLREKGDAGFSSRNPDYCDAPEKVIYYRLDNGQLDEYPASWALSVAELQRAIEHFITHAMPPPWIVWHNDSGDGVVIGKVS